MPPQKQAYSTLGRLTLQLQFRTKSCAHILRFTMHTEAPESPATAEDMNRQNHMAVHNGNVLPLLLQQICLERDQQLSSRALRRQDRARLPAHRLQASHARRSSTGSYTSSPWPSKLLSSSTDCGDWYTCTPAFPFCVKARSSMARLCALAICTETERSHPLFQGMKPP